MAAQRLLSRPGKPASKPLLQSGACSRGQTLPHMSRCVPMHCTVLPTEKHGMRCGAHIAPRTSSSPLTRASVPRGRSPPPGLQWCRWTCLRGQAGWASRVGGRPQAGSWQPGARCLAGNEVPAQPAWAMTLVLVSPSVTRNRARRSAPCATYQATCLGSSQPLPAGLEARPLRMRGGQGEGTGCRAPACPLETVHPFMRTAAGCQSSAPPHTVG